MRMEGCVREEDWYLPLPPFHQKKIRRGERVLPRFLRAGPQARERASAGVCAQPAEGARANRFGGEIPQSQNPHSFTSLVKWWFLELSQRAVARKIRPQTCKGSDLQKDSPFQSPAATCYLFSSGRSSEHPHPKKKKKQPTQNGLKHTTSSLWQTHKKGSFFSPTPTQRRGDITMPQINIIGETRQVGQAISLGAGPCPSPKTTQWDVSVHVNTQPVSPRRQPAKGSTLPKEISEVKATNPSTNLSSLILGMTQS